MVYSCLYHTLLVFYEYMYVFLCNLDNVPIQLQSEALWSQDESFQSCQPILANFFSPFCHCLWWLVNHWHTRVSQFTSRLSLWNTCSNQQCYLSCHVPEAMSLYLCTKLWGPISTHKKLNSICTPWWNPPFLKDFWRFPCRLPPSNVHSKKLSWCPFVLLSIFFW